MTEYWLISAPGDKTRQQTWEALNNVTSKQNSLSSNYQFQIPDLKVGTLDQLVGLSDDLGKLDSFVEQVTRKVASYLGEVLEDQRDKLHENLLANNTKLHHRGSTKSSTNRSKVFHTFCTKPNKSTDVESNSDDELNHSIRCNCSDFEDAQNSECCTTSMENNINSSLASSPLSFTTTGSGGSCGGHGEPIYSWSHEPCSPVPYEQGVDVLAHSEQQNCASDNDNNCSTSAFFDDVFSQTEQCHIISPDDLPSYITHFQWDMAKYPIKQSLRNIADIISKQVAQIDADLKTKSTAYNNLKGSLQNLEKKQTGSLLTRNLADLVKKEHFILDSNYLKTLLVIVPKASVNEWNATYEKLTDMIVPRSSQMITQDNDYALFTVTLFEKVVDEFKVHAREKKFIVRDFTYNEEELAAGKNEITKLVTDKKKQFGPLVRWLKVNFSECFCAWIHVKALRVFVESVLRYGLPVNFQAILLQPNKKCAKRLRDVLNQLYGHLDSSALQSSGQNDNVEIPGLGFGQSDYYPYVYYKINIDMVDNKV